jgi:hypothetical protein
MSGTEKWDWETPEKTLADLREISEKFSACHEPVVSQDGERIALPVQDEEDAWTLCVNGEPWSETFDKLWYHRFGPDGRLAALVQSDDAWTIAIEGAPWDEKFDYVWNAKFSPDGKHIAAQTKREPQDYSIVVDGKVWESTFLSSREFSVDNSGSVAITVQVEPLKEADTVAFMKGTWGLAFNDKVWDTKFVNVYEPRISPDGNSVAAEVRVGICEYSIAIDGNVWDQTFGCVWEPIFHPDGSVIVPARVSGAWSLVKDGNPLWEGTYAQLWHQKVSPDGAKIAAIASPTFGKWTIAVDDKPWTTLFSDAVLEPFFSQDSRHVAAVVKDNERWTIAVDGKPWPERFDMVWSPVFAPDGAMVATKVERNGSYTIAIDGKVWNQTFENLWEPEFSPDGTKLLVKAVKGGKYYRRIVPVGQIA